MPQPTPTTTKEIFNPVITEFEKSQPKFVSGKILIDPYSYSSYPLDTTKRLSVDQWDSLWQKFLKEFTLNHSQKAEPEMVRDAQKGRG